MNRSLEAVSDLVSQYLRVRRALGYKLNNAEYILNRFITYLEDHDAEGVSVADAVGFATAPPDRIVRTRTRPRHRPRIPQHFQLHGQIPTRRRRLASRHPLSFVKSCSCIQTATK